MVPHEYEEAADAIANLRQDFEFQHLKALVDLHERVEDVVADAGYYIDQLRNLRWHVKNSQWSKIGA